MLFADQTAEPLAARMRPRSLDEFIGQDHIIGEGRLLRRAIQADQLSSLIFYGPPGTGKTTLARMIANTTQAYFIAINAVLAGVKEIRAAVETAQTHQQLRQRTILFVDEVHRFNKAQQDALLPWVENGTLILIGATTENPYFEVNKALVSRSRIFQLKPLSEQDLYQVAFQALHDRERGYGNLKVRVEDDALAHLVNVANGDARALLNALELAVETTPGDAQDQIHITLAIAEESIQRRAVLYDKEGDVHFDTISAFIKSLRGSDPDAALYWLARMIYAGEDPRFLFRRMLILASEDVGLADPQAVMVVNACAAAFDRIGLPEGHYPLAQAALYLATAAKSNSTMGFFDALKAVEQEREGDVPNHLKDSNRDKHSFGHGAGYKYPHAYREHWVAQQYLPDNLQGQMFYQPSTQGYEAQISDRLAQQREAQLAAVLETENLATPENLTFSPTIPAQERWLQRTIGQTSQQLATVRDRLFSLAQLQRHEVVLDLEASSGLLTWEAIRQMPEGSVYARVSTTTEAEALNRLGEALPELRRPIVLTVALKHLSQYLNQHHPHQRFDCLLGRNVFQFDLDRGEGLRELVQHLQPQGRLLLAELLPQHSQRIYRLLDRAALNSDLYQRWVEAEEAIYSPTGDASLNWDQTQLQQVLERAGLMVSLERITSPLDLYISPGLLQRWFSPGGDRLSYSDRLTRFLSSEEIASIQAQLTRQLLHQTVSWQRTIGFVISHRK
uniref:Replication-associated recombination protein A n=1 Tax=Cyanothece sp. (strain PCC 7425 / ATCC 29141) TaxID=395961 RepID=B8HK98_CYAP4